MRKTSTIVDGAVMAGVYIILMIISLNLPLIGAFTFFLLPLPIILFVFKHGWKPGLLVWAVTLVLSGVIGGAGGIIYAFPSGFAGIVMGELYKRKKSAFGVLLGGSLAGIFNLLLLLVFAKYLLHFNLVKVTQGRFNDIIDQAAQFYKDGGPETARLDLLREQVAMIPYMLPISIIIGAVLSTLLTQWLASLVLKRMRMEYRTFPPFREWSFPKSFLWYYILALVLTLTRPEHGSGLYILTINLYIILSLVLVVQGLTVIFSYAKKKQWPKALPVFLAVLVIFTSSFLPILMEVVKFLGIIDLGFELKKRINT
ncbi:YybS family protein [Fictibacillus sp. WQ 8-8]|uniref:YybS family protein n=1 Tax=unclassified Fictibacillus TaxID=2644029 RepID=UPI0006A76C41|nr:MULTISPECIES: YybS family protein [unclassified Fictibacillus]MCQ6265050.1 YybS family protein [Fictibacillus sp. WQ 8-8]UZJ79017.1 YybS family protein [Fictibacillus sp. KU28468]